MKDHRSLPLFFLLLIAGSTPFWLIGATGRQLLPGLPISGLAAFCPAAAALAALYLRGGRASALSLLKRSLDAGSIRGIWYVPILLTVPAVHLLAWIAARFAGLAIPFPQISVLSALALFAGFFVGALGEELGWSGYALDPLQARWGAFVAALLLGAIWAAWHMIALVQAHRGIAWIAWWTLATISARVIMVWLYNNTRRSVFAVTLFHAISNLSWQISPNLVAYYDPRLHGIILTVIAAIIVAAAGPVTLMKPGGGAQRLKT